LPEDVEVPVGFRSPEVSVVSVPVGFTSVLCKTSKHMSRDGMIGARDEKKKTHADADAAVLDGEVVEEVVELIENCPD